MIDSHCHLADKQFDADLDAVIARAKETGVEKMVTIADNLKEAEKCLEIAEKYEHIFCTVGVHPHEAKFWTEQSVGRLKELARSSNKVKAVGEIGLDYHYDNSPRDVQQSVLRTQLRIAEDLQLPVVIHNRESIEDMMSIIRDTKPDSAVLHCCTEKWENVQEWVQLGYMLSFTGMATYPKPDWTAEVIKHCPLQQMMIETDAPYLAPIPHRGKRNEPAYVVEVAKRIADLKGISVEEVNTATTDNAINFFSI